MDDLSVSKADEGEGPSGGADVYRLPMPVQHEHRMIQREDHGYRMLLWSFTLFSCGHPARAFGKTAWAEKQKEGKI